MERWNTYLKQGKQELFSRNYEQAVHYLREALEECPVEKNIKLSEILFFMGIALKQLGQNNYAYRCWQNAAMLRDTSETDNFGDFEWKTFYRIQLMKYLATKRKKQLSSLAESDMIHDLLKSAWMEVKDTEGLMTLDYYQRCNVYQSIFIAFPEIDLSGNENQQAMGQILPFFKSSSNDGKK